MPNCKQVWVFVVAYLKASKSKLIRLKKQMKIRG
jgi:hypothetical protein